MDRLTFRPFLYWCHRRREQGPGEMDSPGQAHCYTLWAQVEGTGTLHLPTGEVQLRPGRVALCDPGAVLRWRDPITYLRLAFDLVDRPRKVDGEGVRPVRWMPQPTLVEVFACDLTGLVPVAETPPVLHLLHAANTYYWRSSGEAIRAGLELGRWILDYAQRRSATGFDPWAVPRDANLAERVDSIIEHQPAWGIADIAEQLGVSREHLSRTYRRQRGHPPQHYQLQCRLRGSRWLLEHSEESLTEVARRGGFGSVEALRRTFVRELGVPPGRYRDRCRALPDAVADADVVSRRKGPIWE